MRNKAFRNRNNEEGDVNCELTLSDKIEELGRGARSRDDLFRRAARASGISFSQARKIFYGLNDPKTSVRNCIDKAHAALKSANRKAEEDARKKLIETADVRQLVARAVEVDADLRREVLALVLRKLAGDGAEDRPLADGD